MSAYSDKLMDPRWQKKRLKIMERAGWKCECCGEDKETLAVHHLIYSGEPWDAPDEDLECLCHTCHEFREDFNAFFGRGAAPTRLCYSFWKFYSLLFERRKWPNVSELDGLLRGSLRVLGNFSDEQRREYGLGPKPAVKSPLAESQPQV